MGKIPLLDDIYQTDKSLGIYVFPVQQTEKGGRPEFNISSCSSTNGGFRLIAYEEETIAYNDLYNFVLIDYYIKLRALRKIGFWWQNRSTKQHHSQGNFTANFNSVGNNPATYSTPPLDTESHTYYYTLARVTFLNITSDLDAQIKGTVNTSFHTTSGVNGTTCNL